MSMRERRNFGKIQFSRTEKKETFTHTTHTLTLFVADNNRNNIQCAREKKANNMNAQEDER